jgi:hypothetical protein
MVLTDACLYLRHPNIYKLACCWVVKQFSSDCKGHQGARRFLQLTDAFKFSFKSSTNHSTYHSF